MLLIYQSFCRDTVIFLHWSTFVSEDSRLILDFKDMLTANPLIHYLQSEVTFTLITNY